MYVVHVDIDQLTAIIRTLREEGSDTTTIEAKKASGGMPSDLVTTMSAFANTPGGGVVVLGLDESDGFSAAGVFDATKAKSAMASMARQALDPPVTLTVDTFDLEGAHLMVAEIHEAPASLKPCRVRTTGRAYLRAYDGDYIMSELEVQGFVANRARPGFDRQAVVEATIDDLDPDLLSTYRETCRTSSTTLSRFDDQELLLRTGVLLADGHPTLAGLLALGRYPQQYAPNLVIRASVAPRPGDPSGTRASDVRNFDGPLPTILDEATRWVQLNTRRRVRFGDDGHGRDEPEYPTEAVRELIANALVHRDIGPHTASYAISLTLEHNQLVLSNPGGLWGITVDRLGHDRISSARNSLLLSIAQNVRSPRGRRVVEGLATGIRTVLDTLAASGMVPPAFHDQGVRFTVRVPNHALLATEDLDWLAVVASNRALSDTQRHALVAMRHGRIWTNKTFREDFPRDSTVARADLQGLVDAGLAVAEGTRGGRVYSLAAELGQSRAVEPDLFAGLLDEHARPKEMSPSHTPVRETNEPGILAVLANGQMSVAEIVSRTGLTPRQVKYALSRLRGRGLVSLDGRQGVHDSVYRLLDGSTPSPSD